MRFYIQVYTPTGATTRIAVPIPSVLNVEPRAWSSVAEGGMWDAEVIISGPLNELIGLTAWLGHQIEIFNENGTMVWWGDIDTIEVVERGLRRGIDLTRMSNRIAVRYSQKQSGGGVLSADTTWLDDLYSQALYGIREKRLTPQGPMSSNEATAFRGTELTKRSVPSYTLGIDSAPTMVRLYCRGYYQETKRRYYTNPSGFEGHLVTSTTPYPLGLGIVSQTSVAFSRRASSIAHTTGQFKNFSTGYKFRVSGAGASNNLTYQVVGTDDRDPVSYLSTAVTFSPNDDMVDANGGLGFIDTNDMFQISGSASNNGTWIMDKPGAVAVEINGTFHGSIVVSEAAGNPVQYYRGNQVRVTATPGANEVAGNSVSATVWGQRYYQTFTLAANTTWTVDGIDIQLQMIGGPLDSVKVDLYTDSGGLPGSLLKTASVASSSIPTELGWVSFDFDNLQALSYGTTYGILISRTGANDWDDYYMVGMDLGGQYTGGSCKAYDGSAYQSIGADLVFRVLGGVDTGTQITSMLQATSGYIAVQSVATGVVSNQYREGELVIYDELQVLLRAGTSSGNRLIASTTRNKSVVVSAKADKSTARWIWQGQNDLVDMYGQPAEPGLLPAGEWVKLGDASDLGPWSALSPIFVERVEYSANRGWVLTPENTDDLFDTGASQG